MFLDTGLHLVSTGCQVQHSFSQSEAFYLKWYDFLLLHPSMGNILSCPTQPPLTRESGLDGRVGAGITYVHLAEFIQPEIVMFNLSSSLSKMQNSFQTQRELSV